MTALSKPLTIGATSSTVKPKETKILPKAATKTLSAKTVQARAKPLVTAEVASKLSAAKSTLNVSAPSSAKPSKTAADSNATKPLKPKKVKLVRDSFTIPKPEYLVLDNLKLRAAGLKHPVKKGELLRAGIKALAAMTDAHLLTALQAVPVLKTGRPSK